MRFSPFEMNPKISNILVAMLALLVCTTNVIAQSTKALGKEGWCVEPGTPSLDAQLTQVLMAKEDTTVYVAQGTYEADTYHEAYAKAYLCALSEAAASIGSCSSVNSSGAIAATDETDASTFKTTEKYDVSVGVQRDIKNDNETWRAISRAQVYGESLWKVQHTSEEGDIYRASTQSKWNASMALEQVVILQSMYRKNKNGKIEVFLCLAVPKPNMTDMYHK